MIFFLLIGMTVIVLLLEFAVAPRAPRHLLLRYTFDTQLAEPGETVTFSGRLVNNWLFPVTYFNLFESMPEGAEVAGASNGWTEHRLFLLPRRSFAHTVPFTLPRRGVYRRGRYYLETGDFLGFRTRVTSGEILTDITVMPKLCEDEPILRVLGGYLGDVSVRRYLMEDPVLTVGCREYTGREPMKKISWKYSAKAGKLMVRNSDFTADYNVAVVLNMASGTDAEKEKCLEIVRTVCEALERERIPYQFLSNGDAGNLEEGFGKKHVERLLTNLGRSNLFCGSSFGSLAERCIRERKRNRSFIIVSAPLSPAERDALALLQRYSEHELCVLEAEVDRDTAD